MLSKLGYLVVMKNNAIHLTTGGIMKALRIILIGEFAHYVDICRCSFYLAGCDPVVALLEQSTSTLDIDHHCCNQLASLFKSAQYVLAMLEGAPD